MMNFYCVQNPKMLRIKETLIRKNREHVKTVKELKSFTDSHADKTEQLEACKREKIDVEERLSAVESESQTGAARAAACFAMSGPGVLQFLMLSAMSSTGAAVGQGSRLLGNLAACMAVQTSACATVRKCMYGCKDI